MHSYRAFNLSVSSEVPLADLLPGHQTADVTIRRRRLPTASLAEWNDGGDRVCGFIDNSHFRFCVEGGAEISFDYDPEFIETKMLPTIVMGGLFSTLLRQRGFLVLHASCVAREGRAIAFMGDSGWGKSTLAEYFCQRGYSLLSDDMLVVDFSGETPRAIPGFPQVKLRQQAALHLRDDYDALRPLHAGSDRLVHAPIDQFEESACELAHIFGLEQFGGDANELVELSGPERMRQLILHTRMTSLFTHDAYKRRHFEQCSRLAREVPLTLLRRVVSLEKLGELFQIVSDRVSDSSGTIRG